MSLAALVSTLFHGPAAAQSLTKSAIQVDAGSTKQTGATFGYRLTYNCSSTSGPCLGAQVVDLLPIEVQEISTVPASPTGDVAAINVTPNFGGSGRTRVQFVMNSPLTAGNSGDLVVNVRFPNGSTPNGTTATNTADGINLGASPGTFTTPPVTVTAVAGLQASLSKTLTTSPANLDLPESYRLRISNGSGSGTVNLTTIGPVVDTLPPGTVFNSSSPAADCEPGCDGTTPATVTWASPCSVPLAPNGNCDISVNVTFPSATFTSGANVTNSFTADATPLGLPPQNLGVGQVTHAVTTFVPSPNASLSKGIAGGSPSPPTLNQTFSYSIGLSNSGNVPLDTPVVIDALPVQLQTASVTTGSYSGLSDFGAGVGVRVSYEKNTAPGVFTLWGSSPSAATSTTLTSPPPGLGAGEYLTRIKWEFGQAQVGMSASTAPAVTGRIVNPDNAGAPVAFGNSIQNCVALTAVYTAGPTNVSKNACNTFVLSGPFVQLNPAKDNLSGAGPFNPGQTVSWRLRVRSDARSSDPVPLESLVAADLLPVDLTFVSWTFDDQGTGLPAPQNFQQIPNFAGTGRTLLRWTWNAGSGSLGVNQQVWINISTTIRNGAVAGSLSNQMDLFSHAPGLGLRCSGASGPDLLDLDGDTNTVETACRATGTITVAGIAQLVSSKTIQATCDGGFSGSSAGTLAGGALNFRLRVQNVGTVPMQNFVLVDILPFVGDTGVRDTSPRGSQWTPLLVAPITPPAGTVIYYSTAGNPCRGEVGGPTSGCTPPSWSTVPPTPITTTRSFKVEFGSRVIQPFDFVEFFFTMTTPGTVPPGDVAYNSFAYQADRSDGIGSLAAEPQKVGTSIGPCTAAGIGDFVWADLNGDGIQNDGPTGLDGVFVRLYTPGADGIPGNSDDVLVASTVTGGSPTGTAGWYFFPGLPPGSYYVAITPPPTYVPSPKGLGGSTALDSDGDPATFRSGVVALAAGESNPTVDFGLVPTHFAALGDTVWFDRNGDGLQNESPWDGANGVTVKLFIDGGNGTPSPASDALVATTVTADDAYGRPGHYLFDRLAPGLPYFVQFVLPAAATAFTSRNAGTDATVDSNASTVNGTSTIVTLSPDEVNLTVDAGLVLPAGTLSLGNQVWNDQNDDGIYEPQNGEAGIDGVRLDLYRDVNLDGKPGFGEYVGTTVTSTTGGFAGRYLFDGLPPARYITVVNPANFVGGGALFGFVPSSVNGADPDNGVNGDNNALRVGALVLSLPVTLASGNPGATNDGDADPATNLSLDFGFRSATGAPPRYDYGDAPDVAPGTARGNYNTTALNNGPYHLLGVPGAPFLGSSVDADSGLLQNVAATADDVAASDLTIGSAPAGDENGVTFTGPFTPGAPAAFTVTSGGPAPCHVDAWVDWNQDGVFGNSPGEQIATNLVVPTGAPTVISPTVPATAVPGFTYARFRCSSAGNLGPTGPALDGEVEDYRVAVFGYDYGDAPASYGTVGPGAARHLVNPLVPLALGTCVDTESDGQPSVNADGDDVAIGSSQVGSCADDEDGVTFLSPLTACTTAQLQVFVTAPSTARLDAWVDWDRNGTFDPGDRVFASVVVAPGPNTLSMAVPCTASAGISYARFRLSSVGGLGPTGDAPDGEVEDYAVVLGSVDFGDAPDTYRTTLAAGGPFHRIVAGFSLGATEDAEPDGQPSIGAVGDGADEDGVILPAGGAFTACGTSSVTVLLTNTAGIATPRLDAWIDWAGDGSFNDPRDRIASSRTLVAGSNVLSVAVPCDAKSVASYARFRLSSAGVAGPGGAAQDGEVEDYAVSVRGLDFGDAPAPYPTLLSSDGARHAVLPVGNPTLGTLVDTEPDGQPSAGATGDGADEDGVTFPVPLLLNVPSRISVRAGATGGLVSCWIDFNANGSWTDPGEKIVSDLPVAAGATVQPAFTVPGAAVPGQTYLRCRISSQAGLGVTGLASDGEVEDYAVTIRRGIPKLCSALRLVGVEPDTLSKDDFVVTLEIRLSNTGTLDLTNLQLPVPLALLFPAPAVARVKEVVSATLAQNPSFDGVSDTSLLAPGVAFPQGGTATITLVLFVHPRGNLGPYPLSLTAQADSPEGPVTDVTQDGSDCDPDGDGDPSNNGTPTAVSFPPADASIPAAGAWGLAGFSLLLLAAAWRRLAIGR